MTWQENAACIGAEPTAFDVFELHTTKEWTAIDNAGRIYCSSCPVMRECAELADENRHVGLFGGVYRRVQQGRYTWRVVADGAREPQLTDRRSGVKTGWTAA